MNHELPVTPAPSIDGPTKDSIALRTKASEGVEGQQAALVHLTSARGGTRRGVFTFLFIAMIVVLACTMQGMHVPSMVLWLPFIGLAVILFSSKSSVEVGRLTSSHVEAAQGLVAWKESYNSDLAQLRSSELGRIIAGDEVWQQLSASSATSVNRAWFKPPQNAHERLLYATIYWKILEQYLQGKRQGFNSELLLRKEILWQLRKGVLPTKGSNLGWWARFAALYDYFYGTEADSRVGTKDSGMSESGSTS